MAKKSSGGARGQRAGAQAPPARPAAPENLPAPAAAPAASSARPPAPPSTPAAALPPGQQAAPTSLRTGDLQIILQDREVKEPELPFTRAALLWTYIVRNRLRWGTLPSLRKEKAGQAERCMREMGVDLQSLAKAQMVEVSVPWNMAEAKNWPARIMPWEYVIVSATQNLRNDDPMTIIRHMDCRADDTPRFAGSDREPRVLFVASEPGPLQNRFQFNTERELLQNNLAGARDKDNWRELRCPTKDQLIKALGEFMPDIVHFAGFDTHQAVSILSQIQKEEGRIIPNLWEHDPSKDAANKEAPVKDGYVLTAGTDKMLETVEAEALAKILRNEVQNVAHPPRLVVFNFYNSAARLASLAVTYGVETAIGFQDSFDDASAEMFFAVFYAQLDWSSPSTAIAFRSAWEHLRSLNDRQLGTGVVHWSSVPVLPDKASRRHTNDLFGLIHSQISQDSADLVEPGAVRPGAVSKLVKVTVKPYEDINYSMLQNKRELFNKFTLAVADKEGERGRPIHQRIESVTVTVSLDVGEGAALYMQTFGVEFPFRDLSSEIHLPLTSTLTRTVHESIRTSMRVNIVWGDHVLHQSTTRVRLTPVDQWRDSDDDRRWLPSFVFPRDPAVSQLVDTAQRYVRVLRDDPASGFDGYQSFVPPSSAEEVHLQVQAIWSAIVYDMRLSYINPPPGYSSTLDSQRLRTPSMVRDYHSGTCIDLALFFAACLELVDISPVIFLLDGHAFPGYWRSDFDHADFVRARVDAATAAASGQSDETEGAEVQDDTWFFKKDNNREILQYVHAGKLIPLETVRLTENCGFWEAVEAGMENLRDPTEFEAMVDIKLARDLLVTPLPILEAET